MGTYTFEMRARDADGNLDGTPTKRTFTIDTTKPAIGRVTPRNLTAGVAPGTNVTATFSEAEKTDAINKLTFKLIKKGITTSIKATFSYFHRTGMRGVGPG